MRDYETLSVAEAAPHVLVVTLDRPAAANAVTSRMGRDLLDLFTDLAGLDHGWRCVILTGAGRFFCAGGDLKERAGMSDERWRRQHLLFERMIAALLDCQVPVIAAVNGAAYAGGLEIALACDFIHAAEEARFALTEAKLGFMPGSGGTQTLPRAIGERRAKELLLAAMPFSAREALDWGLVNRVVPAEALMPQAVETARAIAGNAPLATRKIKHVVHHGLSLDLRSALMLELEAYGQLIVSEDRQEGVRAFNEKRPPAFKGR
ncbi:enoyl-CoA hydratase/isomerase family protein [Rhizorhabdus wittichii]|uniref:Enoyl-CoA hydratase/isomerase family protein n=1 Tax=Rhizorhabdus wittichii TaxID=160791 RepID=A0A975D259_9SPHN|nr:enoyl-CoA hydratase-related protein [Rhizorhabdus wittichii]QTH21542.1 enoyl-CoA hydratase/isomerase family protein [Rhizorhabdus wittichii]